ncbi:F0F1 ATP synthase subunit alpha [Candidatus Sneabacter namystus]|uniref:ATP synthase subunit alpha n=1 Tax=Candidatus Sneabacter namystus TaxID=2601646 RepID=A0A5C0UIA3_9RICK|nr:F0F1 ATP synthase subunit alpha [Candidatus Sneabacter namystus]QEK39509.1 F0F1 ATP synthase subunit alpha [Candidatus Sneabacter namystus]
MKLNIESLVKSLKEQIKDVNFEPEVTEVGYVTSVSDGITKVQGLSLVGFNEVVEFDSGAIGIATNLEMNNTGVMLISKEHKVKQGEQVRRTKTFPKAPVGEQLLGRVIDPLGNPLDDKGPIEVQEYRNIETPAPGIIQRQGVSAPMYTGIKAIDTLFPIGRGQRELIIGDRKTGKTTIAIDSIINQKNVQNLGEEPIRCIYVAIGQKCSSVARIVQQLKDHDAMNYTTVVSATESAASQFLAPYFGCALGEFFRDSGKHALVIYDDLSKHAIAYRQISLLARRPPGREAYPGDIFFMHSKLLERAAQLSEKEGGGSLTALPIVETQAGDISSYIPTNVISITDGQIFLEENLFNSGIKPAINIGLSVSRVGYAASIKATKQVASSLKVKLAQYREMENFTKFGSDLNEDTKNILLKGRKLIESLKQDQLQPIPIHKQVITLYAHHSGYITSVPTEEISNFEKELLQHIEDKHENIEVILKEEKEISKNTEGKLDKIIKNFLKSFLSNNN